MTSHELYERITVWLGMSDQIQPPPTQTPGAAVIQDGFENDYDNQMLKNAGDLEVIKELNNTPAGNDLRQAIDFGRSKDRSKLTDIERLFKAVQKYMFQNHLT